MNNKQIKIAVIIVTITAAILIPVLYIMIIGIGETHPDSGNYFLFNFEKINDRTWKSKWYGGYLSWKLNEFFIRVASDNGTILSKAPLKSGTLGIINQTSNKLTISFTDADNNNALTNNDYFLFVFNTVPTINNEYIFGLYSDVTSNCMGQQDFNT